MLASYPGARLIFADSQTTQGSARDPLTNCAKMLRCLYLVDSPGAVNVNIHAYTCIPHTAASCLTCLFCLLYEFPTNHSSVKSLLCLHDPVLSQVKNVMETSRSFPPAGTLWPSAYLGMYLGSCWCHASKEEPPLLMAHDGTLTSQLTMHTSLIAGLPFSQRLKPRQYKAFLFGNQGPCSLSAGASLARKNLKANGCCLLCLTWPFSAPL